MSFGTGPFGVDPLGTTAAEVPGGNSGGGGNGGGGGGGVTPIEPPPPPPGHGANLIHGKLPTSVQFSKLIGNQGMHYEGDLGFLTDGVEPSPVDLEGDWPAEANWVSFVMNGPGVQYNYAGYVALEYDLGGEFWIGGFEYIEGFAIAANQWQWFVPRGIDLQGGPTLGQNTGAFKVEYFNPQLNTWMQTLDVFWDDGYNFATQKVGTSANFAHWLMHMSASYDGPTYPRYASKVRIIMSQAGSYFGDRESIECAELKIYAPVSDPVDFAFTSVTATGPNSLRAVFSTPYMPHNQYVNDPNSLNNGTFSFSNGSHSYAYVVVDPMTLDIYFDPPIEDGSQVSINANTLWSDHYLQQMPNPAFEFTAWLSNDLPVPSFTAQSTGSTTVDLTFSSSVSGRPGMLDPSTYSIINAGGLSVLGVTAATPSKMRLTTSEQGPWTYTAVVSSSVIELQNYIALFQGTYVQLANLVSATPLSPTTLVLNFDQLITSIHKSELEPYSLTSNPSGLQILSAEVYGPHQILLQTTQQQSVEYEIQVSYSDMPLNTSTQTFTGMGVVDIEWPPSQVEMETDYVPAVETGLAVTDLRAITHPDGRRIDLTWKLPEQFYGQVKIVRREKNHVFDLTDPHTVVYEGEPIEKFSDSGAAFGSNYSSPIYYSMGYPESPYTDRVVPAYGRGTFNVGDTITFTKTNAEGQLLYKEDRVISSIDDSQDAAYLFFDVPLEHEYDGVYSGEGQPNEIVSTISKTATERLKPNTFYYYSVVLGEGEPT